MATFERTALDSYNYACAPKQAKHQPCGFCNGWTQVTNDLWPRGSEWRKWDLHVHSPASFNFTGDYNQFIIQLGGADCDVIGINDYFSVAGYREVLRHLHAAPGAPNAKAARAQRSAVGSTVRRK